jgi:hypothetical protein
MGYYSLDVNQIQCRLKHLLDDVIGVPAQVQARTDAQVESMAGVAGQDRPITSVGWGGKVRLQIGEYACGYEARWSRAYGSDDTPEEVIARFRQQLVGWRVEFQTEDEIGLSNRDYTTYLRLTIIRPRKVPRHDFDLGSSLGSAAPGTRTVYEIDLHYGEPRVRLGG